MMETALQAWPPIDSLMSSPLLRPLADIDGLRGAYGGRPHLLRHLFFVGI